MRTPEQGHTKRYELITAKINGKRTTRRCRIVSESPEVVLADILDIDWNVGTGKFDADGREIHQQWLLSTDLIVKRVQMRENLTYGTWEPVK